MKAGAGGGGMERGVEVLDVVVFEVGMSPGGLGDDTVGCVKLIPDMRARFAYGSSSAFLSAEVFTLSVEGSSS